MHLPTYEYRKERVIYALALLLSVIGVLFLWNQNASLHQTNSKLLDQNTVLKTRLDSIRNADRELLPVTRFQPLTQTEWRALVNIGLAEPRLDLFHDFEKQASNIMPDDIFEAGSFKISPPDFYLLNQRWVLAGFHDSAGTGQLLLEYSISKNREISWRLLDNWRIE